MLLRSRGEEEERVLQEDVLGPSANNARPQFLPFFPAVTVPRGSRSERRCLPLRFPIEAPADPVDLPDHVLYQVFRNLQDTDLCRAALVCKQWQEQSQHKDFWTTFKLEGRNITQAKVITLCQRHPGITHLNVRGVRLLTEELLELALLKLPQLTHLVLGQQGLPEALLPGLRTYCPNLEHLELSDPSISTGPPQDLNFTHPKLISLVVVGCRAARATVDCVRLQKLALRRLYASPLILACPELTDLDLSGSKLTDSLLRSAITYHQAVHHQLTALNLSGCTPLSDETLREVTLACPHLRYVDLSQCPNITLDNVRFPSLEQARLLDCDGILAASIQSLNFSVALQEVTLDDCALLTGVDVALPQLQQLSCNGCRCLTEVTAHCPMLHALTIKGCNLLRTLEVRSSRLASLTLQHLIELKTVTLQCPLLEEVELSDCDKLSDSVFSVLSSAPLGGLGNGGCPLLRDVILDQCEGLVHGALRSATLERLSLVGCKGLTSLDLMCPKLTLLKLNECDRLLKAHLKPVGLDHQLDMGICPRLEELHLEAPLLRSLQLCGCGFLRLLTLACPALASLNTTFCSRMDSMCLVAVPQACPALTRLQLAYCSTALPGMLPNLYQLKGLTNLDLSYTEVETLDAVFSGCSALRSLRLSACKHLRDDALAPLLIARDACSSLPLLAPSLTELDLSYCSLGAAALRNLLTCARRLRTLNLSACANATQDMWPLVGAGGEDADRGAAVGAHVPLLSLQGKGDNGDDDDIDGEDTKMAATTTSALSQLMCVGCKTLRAVRLGTGGGLPGIRGRDLGVLFARLQHLNLRLSAVAEVYVALPALLSLDLRDCADLTRLRLACPKLSVLHLQACRSLELESVCVGVSGAAVLETLDVRDMPQLGVEDIEAIRAVCPTLRRLFTNAAALLASE